MATDFIADVQRQLQDLNDAGLFKRERVITSQQGAVVRTSDGRDVINLCANNYLGLSAHPQVIAAAHK
ncbi:MAG TPA: glycine C-acetyltransferase, partial [Burkholderiaceae bacterium]|nr:glycine C-acetyltransferase [Burkholderiaceae bacterium]